MSTATQSATALPAAPPAKAVLSAAGLGSKIPGITATHKGGRLTVFGHAWTTYAALTPGFIPRRRRTKSPSPQPPAAHREEVYHR